MDLIRNQFFIGFIINFILIYVFSKIPLMTKSGWVSAGILGTILWGCLSWQGWVSVVIYLLFGSLVTKIGFKFKKQQEFGNKKGGIFWNVIGPEGGWSAKEIDFFKKNNITFVKLSHTILRTSTASINASSILNQWRIDLKLMN